MMSLRFGSRFGFKALLAALLGFVPASAMACPDLAGVYMCNYKGFNMEIEITQRVDAGTTVYQVDGGGEIFADGQPHQTDSLHSLLDGYASNYNYVAQCQGDSMNFEGTADLSRGGQGQVQGVLTKMGNDLTASLQLVTTRRTMNVNLSCYRN